MICIDRGAHEIISTPSAFCFTRSGLLVRPFRRIPCRSRSRRYSSRIELHASLSFESHSRDSAQKQAAMKRNKQRMTKMMPLRIHIYPRYTYADFLAVLYKISEDEDYNEPDGAVTKERKRFLVPGFSESSALRFLRRNLISQMTRRDLNP